ncbi:MAG TPA: hypothetical protein VEF76_06310, partial [Patescibacteria group bacterium]|nr:hypothetical protein [Patescibacteria group bacterium]
MSRQPEKPTPYFMIVRPFNMVAPPSPVCDASKLVPPAPPVDRGDWNVPVTDENGQPAFARPAVAVDFIGTITTEKPDPFQSEAQKAKRQAAIDKEAEL